MLTAHTFDNRLLHHFHDHGNVGKISDSSNGDHISQRTLISICLDSLSLRCDPVFKPGGTFRPSLSIREFSLLIFTSDHRLIPPLSILGGADGGRSAHRRKVVSSPNTHQSPSSLHLDLLSDPRFRCYLSDHFWSQVHLVHQPHSFWPQTGQPPGQRRLRAQNPRLVLHEDTLLGEVPMPREVTTKVS